MKTLKSEKAALSAAIRLRDLCVSTIGGEWHTFHERIAYNAWKYWVSTNTPNFILKIWPMDKKEYVAVVARYELYWSARGTTPFEACFTAMREIQKDLIPRMELCAEFGKYMDECPAGIENIRRMNRQETRPEPVNRLARKVKT